VLLNLREEPRRVENTRDGVRREFIFHRHEIVVTPRIGNSIEVGGVQPLGHCLKRTGERASARRPPRRCASRAVRSAVRTGDPGPAGPRDRRGETAAHAGGPRVVAGPRGRTPVTRGASAERRGARAVPRLAGARVDGGRRGPACAAREARVRRWVRIGSITDVWVMPATRRLAPWQDGHASGSTSKICWSRVAHRRLASVGASRGAGMITGGASSAAGSA
jgi:hypothetical protein